MANMLVFIILSLMLEPSRASTRLRSRLIKAPSLEWGLMAGPSSVQIAPPSRGPSTTQMASQLPGPSTAQIALPAPIRSTPQKASSSPGSTAQMASPVPTLSTPQTASPLPGLSAPQMASLSPGQSTSQMVSASVTPFTPSMAAPSPALANMPPNAGDLVSGVRRQLAVDHRTLGMVSASLMSVQTSVDKTEQSMLGKVLDLQTARSFFSRHEQIDTANSNLKYENTKLNSQVEQLSLTISQVQKKYLSDAQKNRISEARLHQELIQSGSLIQNLNAELSHSDEIKEELRRLTKIHQDLMRQALQAAEAGRQAETMLVEARGTNRNEVLKHSGLRRQLVAMNNYSTRCYADVAKKSRKLGMLMVSESKDSQAAEMTLKQKKKANEAAEQRLLAEHALLASQVKKIETQALQAVDKVKDLRGDFKVLERNIVKAVHKMEDEIKAERERIKSLSKDLMENAQAEEESNTRKESLEARIEKLIAEVHESENPIIIAQTEGQNQALEAELAAGFVMWKDAKRVETAALLNVDQAAAELAAQNASLKLADEALATARMEGQKKVAEAVKKAEAGKAKAQILIDKSRAAILKRCKPDWDAIWNTKRAKLLQCKTQKEELSMEMARKDILVQTLKAQAR